jgi:hypothetical protein
VNNHELDAVKSSTANLRDSLETLKNFGGVIAAVLQYIDGRFHVIPVDSQVRTWGFLAAIIAVVAGLGAHQSSKHVKGPSIGWVFFWSTVGDLVALICVITFNMSLPSQAAASAGRVLYAMFFILLGGALGGFLY